MPSGQCLPVKVASFGKGGESDERKNILDYAVYSDGGLSAAGFVTVYSCTDFCKMRGETTMKKEFEENDYEYDTTVDALLAFIDLLPKDKVKMIDFDRYKIMMQTAAELKDILCENHEEGQLDIDICEMFNMGSITAQLSDLTICNIPQFTEMISKADNFEIYPRTDGTIQLNITFQSMLKAI